uniref:Uncharacterized protein n=1 Tax=Siphoviridae sp. ctmpG14 TaxID=2825654 RepID=A0A8S5PAK4_9CAUD|nr:MAG TPA: hypothetical protein [Siphoviridae sp. ctmpG14]
MKIQANFVTKPLPRKSLKSRRYSRHCQGNSHLLIGNLQSLLFLGIESANPRQ